jgi:hypothetical protein
MKFPFYFTPHEINGTLYSDGGLQNNCPSNSFEIKGEFNSRTLSARLDHQNEINYFEKGIKPPKKRPRTLLQMLAAVLGSATKAQDRAFFSSPYKKRTVYSSTLDVGTLDFDLPEDKKQALIASGQYAVMCYFHENHPDLTKDVYDAETLRLLELTDYPLTITDFMAAVEKLKAEGKYPLPSNVVPLRADMESIDANLNAMILEAPAPRILHAWHQIPHYKDFREKVAESLKPKAHAKDKGRAMEEEKEKDRTDSRRRVQPGRAAKK